LLFFVTCSAGCVFWGRIRSSRVVDCINSTNIKILLNLLEILQKLDPFLDNAEKPINYRAALRAWIKAPKTILSRALTHRN
jgi:hypothetical protein